MNERPILFSAPMVRAILEGRKTQTRRVVKDIIWDAYEGPCRVRLTPEDLKGDDVRNDFHDGGIRCPYGAPGDRLWVRETWYCDDYRVQQGPYLKPDDMDIEEAREDGTLIYRASSGDHPYEAEQPIWSPSIHMPRWASRIDLEVTGVRVERLQDISEADAEAEGCQNSLHLHGGRFANENFRWLWESINGDGSWDANPWVWVVEFRGIRP